MQANNDVLEILQKVFNIEKLYPYQRKALPHVLSGKNVIIAAPTAAGKTIIGYAGIINSLLQGKRAIYLTPLKALAEEKHRELKQLQELGYSVTISTGDYDRVEKEAYKSHIVICTYEKFDSMLRHDTRVLKNVGVVVADEVHMIGDPERGPALEVSLTKSMINEGPQIIGLSATMSNGEELAKWLNAVYISTDWRPVKLYKGIHFEDKVIIYDGSEPVDYIGLEKSSVESLLKYFLESGGQALIFVNSRNRSESYAKKLSEFVSKYVDPEKILSEMPKLSTLISAEGITELERTDYELMAKGIAYHHAGLSLAARSTIEHAFLNNIIKVIIATPTLAAGCNLPARLSLVLDVYRRSIYGVSLIPRREIEQMLGRAGRPQYDKEGYGIIHATTRRSLEDIYQKYFIDPLEPVYSNLANRRALRTYTLSFISESAQTYDSIVNLFDKTFFGWTFGTKDIQERISRILFYLEDEELITRSGNLYVATPFGKRVSELYIDPMTASEFRRFLVNFTQEELSPIIVFFAISRTPDMTLTVRVTPRRKEIEKLLSKISEDETLSKSLSKISFDLDSDFKALYLAFILNDWINEVPESLIYEKWGIGIGDLRVITNTAEWLVYSLSEVSKILGTPHYAYLTTLTVRVKYGIKEELIPLVLIRNIGRKRARVLYNHGIRSPEDIVRLGIEGLKRIRGIGESLAQEIYEESLKIIGKALRT